MPARRSHFGSVRRLPSKRWQASYWHDGARHVAPSTFKTKTDAQAWLASAETDINRGLWVDPAGGRLTVAELAARWLDADLHKRSSTRKRDEQVVRLHILPELGEVRIGRVTQPQVQRLVNGWTRARAARTVRRHYAVLQAMFSSAVSAGELARSPCRDVNLPAVEGAGRPALTPEQVGAVAEAAEGRYQAMVWLGALLGLRWGEVAGLKVGALDLLGGTLRVAEQRSAGGLVGPPKSRAARRTLSLSPGLVELMAAHLAAVGLTGADTDALVFTTTEGAPLDYSNWRRRVWVPATTAAKVPWAGFHDLRRANATQMVTGGVDVRTAQARLGHGDARLTLEVYAQATTDADRAAAGVLENRFMSASRTQRARHRPTT